MKSSKIVAMGLMILLGLCQMSPAQAAPPAQELAPQTKTPIQHLVFLMQENHTYDNYFGLYPGGDGLPLDTKMPADPNNLSAGYVQPWHVGTTTITDISHNKDVFDGQFNNGKMDGFVSTLNARHQSGKIAMGY